MDESRFRWYESVWIGHSGRGGTLHRNYRLWVALAAATVIAGLFVGFGMSNGAGNSQSAKRVGIASRLAAGTQSSVSSSSALEGVAGPEIRARLAGPHAAAARHRSRAGRQAQRHARAVEESRRSAGFRAPVALRRFRPRPAAATCPRRSRTSTALRTCAAAFRPTPRATWGRTTTCSGSTSTSRSTRRQERRSARRCPATPCGSAIRTLPSAPRTTTATRSCSTTSIPAAGSRRSLPCRTTRPGPSTSASRSRLRTTRPGAGAATSTPCHANKLNDYPKFGVWPTQNAYMATINQFTEPGDGWGGVGVMAFERDQMLNCGPARDALQGHVPDRRRTSGAACSRRIPTARRCHRPTLPRL